MKSRFAPEKGRNFEKIAWVLIISGGIVAIGSIVFFAWGRLGSLTTSEPIDSALFDHFGSFFSGVVGSLWTLASVILFYLTVKEQRGVQRTDRVESAFFQLMTIYNEGISTLKLMSTDIKNGEILNKTEIVGRDIFFSYHNFFHEQMEAKANRADIKDVYRTLYDQSSHNLRYTFRMIVYIIEYVDSARILKMHKKKLIGILRVQLSDYEMVILYFNLLYIDQFSRFNELLNRYGFFDDMELTLLVKE